MKNLKILLRTTKSAPVVHSILILVVILLHGEVQAQAKTCHQLFNHLSTQLNQNEDLEKKYALLEQTLYRGYVTEFKPFSANGNRNKIWKLKIKNPKNNHEVTALLKPRPFKDGDGWNRTTMEYVGYRVSQWLNMDYIAPVAYRRNFSFGDQFVHEGSIQLFVENAKSLHHFGTHQWPVSKDIFLSDARVLDFLLQNPDRHKDNFMLGTHWMTGQPTMLLIDQAASLKSGFELKLNSPGWGLEGPIKKYKRSTYLGLMSLSKNDLVKLKEFITDPEIEKILSRRDQVILEINNLIKTHGENLVLIDE